MNRCGPPLVFRAERIVRPLVPKRKENEMEQLTKEQAIAFHDSNAWQKWDAKTRALFQMEQDCLCMPFYEFQKAVEEALGRPVWTHEFGLNRGGLLAELQGKATAPSFAEIVAMLPADKTVVAVL
jgi:hypothetical protein